MEAVIEPTISSICLTILFTFKRYLSFLSWLRSNARSFGLPKRASSSVPAFFWAFFWVPFWAFCMVSTSFSMVFCMFFV